jgi:hypothetical protein
MVHVVYHLPQMRQEIREKLCGHRQPGNAIGLIISGPGLNKCYQSFFQWVFPVAE